ncbi:MAG: MerR family transcriptional regulator [Umezawaea sp.]
MFIVYRIGEFAQKIGRSAGTVRRWEHEGRIQARRGSTGQRRFTDIDVRAVPRRGFDDTSRKTGVYCRVSSPRQKDNLASQVAAMEQFFLANQESLSPRQEMVVDLVTIVHTFSGCFDGLRRYETTLEDELSGEVIG